MHEKIASVAQAWGEAHESLNQARDQLKAKKIELSQAHQAFEETKDAFIKVSERLAEVKKIYG